MSYAAVWQDATRTDTAQTTDAWLLDAANEPWKITADRFEEGCISLIDTCATAADDEWDGPGSRRVSARAFLSAERMLQLLPPSFPNPEIALYRDGEIEFEWYAGRGRVLTVSIGESDILHYATLAPGLREHGAIAFEGSFPTRFTNILAVLFR